MDPSKWVLCLRRSRCRYSIHFGYYGMTLHGCLTSAFLFKSAFWRLRSRSTFATLLTSSGKRPLSWHPKFLLLSKDLWALKGYFINANGLNNVTQPALYCFSNNFHYVGPQKTRFTRIKTFQRAKHLWHKPPPPLNTNFWSQYHMDSFTGLPMSVCLSRRLVRFATYGTSLFPTQAIQIFSLGNCWYKNLWTLSLPIFIYICPCPVRATAAIL